MKIDNILKLNTRLAFILIMLAFVSCSNEEDAMAEYGQISLNIDVQSNILVGTRASNAIDLENYLVAIYQGDKVKLSTTKYSELPLYLYYPAGAGYIIYVGNCTEGEALSANDNWGRMRIAGAKIGRAHV